MFVLYRTDSISQRSYWAWSFLSGKFCFKCDFFNICRIKKKTWIWDRVLLNCTSYPWVCSPSSPASWLAGILSVHHHTQLYCKNWFMALFSELMISVTHFTRRGNNYHRSIMVLVSWFCHSYYFQVCLCWWMFPLWMVVCSLYVWQLFTECPTHYISGYWVGAEALCSFRGPVVCSKQLLGIE